VTQQDDDDPTAFREAVRDARPLKVVPAKRPPAPRPTPRAALRRADERVVLDESLQLSPDEIGVETGDELLYRRPHVPASVLKRLRRGDYRREDELDLHGYAAEAARAELHRFIHLSVQQDLRCVRVIHGKGRGSGPRGPVIKKLVNAWLRKLDAVLAFATARPADGGTGAVYVLLGEPRR